MILIQMSFASASVSLILGISVFFRGLWKDDQWKRHQEGTRDLSKNIILSVILWVFASVFKCSEGWFAERYVENIAKASLHDMMPQQIKSCSREYTLLLNGLSELKPDSADHRAHVGAMLSLVLESNRRPLHLHLWKKTSWTDEYSVYIQVIWPSRIVRVGMIQLDPQAVSTLHAILGSKE